MTKIGLRTALRLNSGGSIDLDWHHLLTLVQLCTLCEHTTQSDEGCNVCSTLRGAQKQN